MPLVPLGFSFVRELGRGSFGCVLHVRDRLGDSYAIKKLLPDHRGQPAIRSRFVREAEALETHADNPNVVDSYYADLQAAEPYIVLEYANGGSLQSWVTTRHSAATIAFAIAEAAAGLAGVHAAGGFHRDVKPLNLLAMMTEDRRTVLRVKISDFGLARQPRPGRSMTWSQQGTPGYIAPEVMNGAPFDAPADIFSLAVTACELATGTRDFRRLQSAPIPQSMRDLIRRMGAGIAWRRPTAAEVVVGMNAVRQEIALAKEAAEQRRSHQAAEAQTRQRAARPAPPHADRAPQERRATVRRADPVPVFAALGIAALGLLGLAAFSK